MQQKHRKLTAIQIISFLFKIQLSKRATQVVYMTIFLTTCIFSFILGIYLLKLSPNQSILSVQYSDNLKCLSTNSSNNKCTITFTVPNSISNQLQIYYNIDNFYQDDKVYILSINYKQLYGNILGMSEAVKSCGSYTTNAQMGKNQSWAGQILDPNNIASPCGLQAKNIFNDTYKLLKDGKQINIRTTNLIKKYIREPNSEKTQWTNVQNDKFEIWMNTGINPKIQKLYGVLDMGLQAGNYSIIIDNNAQYEEATKWISIQIQNHDFGQSNMIGKLFLFSAIGLLASLVCASLLSFKLK